MDWKKRFAEAQIIWQYPGYGPHAAFTLSEKHSSCYFNSDVIGDVPNLLQEVGYDLHEIACSKLDSSPDWVITYAPYGVTIGSELAKLFACQSGYIDLNRSGLKNFELRPAEKVLVCADDLYSGKNISALLDILNKQSAEIIYPLIFIANCSGKSTVNGHDIVSLVDLDIDIWNACECPLCLDGSPAIEARKHWQVLCSPIDLKSH